MTPKLQRGRIVWGEVSDRRGKNPKLRPAVVLTPTDQITPGGRIVVAAVSTLIGHDPPERTVALPWHRDRNASKTRLTEPSEVVCDWLITVPVADVRHLGGLVPPAKLLEVIGKIEALTSPPAPPPPDDPPPPEAT